MTKTVLLAAATMAVLAAPAAAADRFAYFGGVRITAVSSACRSEGSADVGLAGKATFQRDQRSGTARDSLRMTFRLADYTFIPLDGSGDRASFGKSGPMRGIYIYTRGNPGIQEGTYASFALSPSKVGATVDAVTVTGKLANFDSEGCTVTFVAQGVRRPE